MNKGDTIKFLLNISINGEPLSQSDVDEIEFVISNISLQLSKGEIVWDSSEGCYTVTLSQSQTLSMKNENTYQIRVLKDDEVISTNIGIIPLGDSLSSKILVD